MKPKLPKHIVVSDCEGPISINDNAYELAAHFIPNGETLFSNLSCYDDVLADIVHKSGYSVGSTLRLILPFFKAYNLTDQQLEEFCTQNIALLPHITDTLNYINGIAEVFIVSTSYEHYIKALCKTLNFPYKNTYCTKVSLDKYPLNPQEQTRLKELAQEIVQMPKITIPPNARSLDDFPATDQATIQRLDEIFWVELPKTSAGKLLTEVVTIGGQQKAEAICDAAKRTGTQLSNVMYVGDSITDVEAFKLVRESGGLAVSFNGNAYAVRNAGVSVLSESTLATAALAELFCRVDNKKLLLLVRVWCKEVLTKNSLSSMSMIRPFTVYPSTLPEVQVITPKNMEKIVQKSCAFREKIRGENIGRLG
ncbi:MAG: HAD hydrolase family protein [Nitrososphaerota archaeon]|jgi:energy-converting hydrogenase A subunit R|nr:HAD hydrolase family protein [Nitrososphaerota archaeon]